MKIHGIIQSVKTEKFFLIIDSFKPDQEITAQQMLGDVSDHSSQEKTVCVRNVLKQEWDEGADFISFKLAYPIKLA